jgi:hypothetical protein
MEKMRMESFRALGLSGMISPGQTASEKNPVAEKSAPGL